MIFLVYPTTRHLTNENPVDLGRQIPSVCLCEEVIWKGVGMKEINGRMRGDELDKQEDTNEATIYIKDTHLDQSLSLPFADR